MLGYNGAKVQKECRKLKIKQTVPTGLTGEARRRLLIIRIEAELAKPLAERQTEKKKSKKKNKKNKKTKRESLTAIPSTMHTGIPANETKKEKKRRRPDEKTPGNLNK